MLYGCFYHSMLLAPIAPCCPFVFFHGLFNQFSSSCHATSLFLCLRSYSQSLVFHSDHVFSPSHPALICFLPSASLSFNFFSQISLSPSLHILYTGYSLYPFVLANMLLLFEQSYRVLTGTILIHTGLPFSLSGNISVSGTLLLPLLPPCISSCLYPACVRARARACLHASERVCACGYAYVCTFVREYVRVSVMRAISTRPTSYSYILEMKFHNVNPNTAMSCGICCQRTIPRTTHICQLPLKCHPGTSITTI